MNILNTAILAFRTGLESILVSGLVKKKNNAKEIYKSVVDRTFAVSINNQH